MIKNDFPITVHSFCVRVCVLLFIELHLREWIIIPYNGLVCHNKITISCTQYTQSCTKILFALISGSALLICMLLSPLCATSSWRFVLHKSKSTYDYVYDLHFNLIFCLILRDLDLLDWHHIYTPYLIHHLKMLQTVSWCFIS